MPRARWSGVGALIGLALERTCAGCGAEDVLLCELCQGELVGEPFLAWPTPRPPGLPPPFAVAPYENAVRAILLAHKEDARLALARPLGGALARAVARSSAAESLLLVPVPSRRSAVRARGHDAMLRTARVAATRLRGAGRRVQVLPVLRPTRSMADQAGLSSAARRANLAGALVVPATYARRLADSTVVVVDDVITTGSTLEEAVRALVTANAGDVAVATVAATVRRDRPRTADAPAPPTADTPAPPEEICPP